MMKFISIRPDINLRLKTEQPGRVGNVLLLPTIEIDQNVEYCYFIYIAIKNDEIY